MKDCKKYFKCENRLVVATCPEGEIYWDDVGACVDINFGIVKCDQKKG